jgi:hypothetical protein
MGKWENGKMGKWENGKMGKWGATTCSGGPSGFKGPSFIRLFGGTIKDQTSNINDQSHRTNTSSLSSIDQQPRGRDVNQQL